MVAVEGRVDLNDVVVVDDGDPSERVVDEVVVVKADVVLVVDGALREADSESADTSPSLRMFLIGAGKEHHSTHGLCSLADYLRPYNCRRLKSRSWGGDNTAGNQDHGAPSSVKDLPPS